MKKQVASRRMAWGRESIFKIDLRRFPEGEFQRHEGFPYKGKGRFNDAPYPREMRFAEEREYRKESRREEQPRREFMQGGREEQKRKFGQREEGSRYRYEEEEDRFYEPEPRKPQTFRKYTEEEEEERDMRNRLKQERIGKEKWQRQEIDNQYVNSRKKCFNGNEAGHHHSVCTNPPFCYSCKKSGHKAHNCLDKIELKTCGFGIPGSGFYSKHIPVMEEKSTEIEVTGLMTIIEGTANVKNDRNRNATSIQRSTQMEN